MTLPSGTVTFLFTDIEGSTKLWETHQPAMRLALAQHDALLRQAIEARNGVVFKTVGDAFCAAFASASEALQAALAIHLALQSATWGATGPLRVRIGLHTGSAEERENDYFGPTLNRVARLQSLAYGDQILLSQTTYHLVIGQLPDQVSVKDLGSHRLKDLQAPEQIWQLLHPLLPSDFPPLKSLNNLPNNLPNQLTSFIGREQEIEEIRALLNTCRLLTLTGSGGCGKTRLALQLSADLLGDFPDGVWLVELASLTNPALILPTMAGALGVREDPGRPLMRTLIEHLSSRTLLLLLDNCEHLLKPCAELVDALLKSCARLTILATSRQALGVYGEHSYRVPSLSLPDLKAITTDSVRQAGSAHLFIERALLSRPDFALTNRNAPSLARLCHRLDGIPLAIELAAARVRALTVEEVARRLDDRFRLLTGGSRTAMPRQQTLRALIDWSYDLLNAQEQTLLNRLSVFSGGWTLEAAEQVCSDPWIVEREPSLTEGTQTTNHEPRITTEKVLDLLSSLVDKSLVLAETQGEQTRYRLLETVRQYAQEKLDSVEDPNSIQRQHRNYFTGVAISAAQELQGAQQAVWLARLEMERDNLRGALDAYANDPMVTPDSAPDERRTWAENWLTMASALERFWYLRGPISEGRERCEQALTARSYVGTDICTQALNSAGILAAEQGDYEAAHTYHREGLALRRLQGDRRGIATSLNNLAVVANGQGDYPVMQRYLEESLELYRELESPLGMAATLLNLGSATSKQQNYALAERYYLESLTLLRPLNHSFYLGAALHNLADVMLRRNEAAQAQRYLQESVAIYRELGNTNGLILSLERLAAIAVRQQRFALAASWLGTANTARMETGSSRAFSEEQDFEEDRQLTRFSLGEEAFATAWTEGEHQKLEEAIEEALRT